MKVYKYFKLIHAAGNLRKNILKLERDYRVRLPLHILIDQQADN